MRSCNEKRPGNRNYAKLHGALASNDNLQATNRLETASTLNTAFASRRVCFDENLECSDEKPNHGSFRNNSSRYQTIPHVMSEHDDELHRVMDHYGLDRSGRQAGDHNNDRNSHRLNLPAPAASSAPHNHWEHNQRLASFGVSVASGFSNLCLGYPCVVLRRQCQVNNTGKVYHLTPFTVFGVALNLQRAQGLTCLWKGIGSKLWVSAITVGGESVVSEFSSLPLELSADPSIRSVVSHLGLKLIIATVVSPFYSAHLVESVQSEMTSDTPGLFTCLIDGFCRVFGIGHLHTFRVIPFYKLILPTVANDLLRYVLTSSLQHLILRLMRRYERHRHERRMARMRSRSPAALPYEHQRPLSRSSPCPSLVVPSPPYEEMPSSLLSNHYPELISSFIAELISDTALFPVETVLNRLHIQGTRTIIDNTDTGRGFMPVSSRHDGFVDCFRTTIACEGYSGLYRGFGCLLLQHSLKYAVIRFTRFALEIMSP